MTERNITVESAITTGYRFFVRYKLHATWSFLNASPEEWSENLKAVINKLGGK